jgi:threonine dehydrogenase-like Zn-dependent dehydrogenase
LRIADRWGIDEAVNTRNDDAVQRTHEFTKQQGIDVAVFAFAGPAGQSYEDVCSCLKKSPDGHLMGRIVMVGGSELELAWIPGNFDVRIAARTGPGYHDEQWEVGRDYPPVFVPWTTNSNLGLCMRLLGEKRFNVDCMTTHVIPLDRVEEEIEHVLDNHEDALGVVFTNGDHE